MKTLTSAFVGAVFAVLIVLGITVSAGPSRSAFYDSSGGGTSITLPGSSTDNAIVRWDGTSGAALQDSGWTVDDTGNLVSTVADGPTIIGDGAGSTVMVQLRTNDPDTGIGTGASFNQMQLLAGGNGAYVLSTGIYGGLSNSNGGLLAEAATATNPSVVPYGTDQDTGMGRAAADELSLISGGIEGVRIIETGSAISTLRLLIPVQDCPATCTIGDTCIDNATTVEWCLCTGLNTWNCVNLAVGPSD